MDDKQYFVAKDEDGVLRPMWFIYATGESGELAKERFLEKEKKNGATVVVVELVEVK